MFRAGDQNGWVWRDWIGRGCFNGASCGSDPVIKLAGFAGRGSSDPVIKMAGFADDESNGGPAPPLSVAVNPVIILAGFGEFSASEPVRTLAGFASASRPADDEGKAMVKKINGMATYVSPKVTHSIKVSWPSLIPDIYSRTKLESHTPQK